ncbi:MAG: hypothetical protein R3D25_08005 [Geminicoccaceae bacterium]
MTSATERNITSVKALSVTGLPRRVFAAFCTAQSGPARRNIADLDPGVGQHRLLVALAEDGLGEAEADLPGEIAHCAATGRPLADMDIGHLDRDVAGAGSSTSVPTISPAFAIRPA